MQRFLSQVKYVFITSLLRVPWVTFSITATRFIFFKYILRQKLSIWSKDKDQTVLYEYSKSHYSKFLIRPLTRSIIPISLASSLFWPEPFNKKLLILGPRYESDYYIARGYGFAKENITLVDHFSYSKKILVGDAHEINFPRDSFDVVIASWILVYSTNQARILSEMRRVLKPETGIAIVAGDCEISPNRYGLLESDKGPYIFDAEHLKKLWSNPNDELILSWPTAERVINSVPQALFAIQKSK